MTNTSPSTNGPSTTNSPALAVVETDLTTQNDGAIRLWQIDQALLHLTRNQGILGLGANVVQQSLKTEKAEIIDRLRALGEEIASFDRGH